MAGIASAVLALAVLAVAGEQAAAARVGSSPPFGAGGNEESQLKERLSAEAMALSVARYTLNQRRDSAGVRYGNRFSPPPREATR